MLIAVTYNSKKVQWFEFMFGIFISLGMVLFAAADFQVYPKFDFIGMSVLFDYVGWHMISKILHLKFKFTP